MRLVGPENARIDAVDFVGDLRPIIQISASWKSLIIRIIEDMFSLVIVVTHPRAERNGRGAGDEPNVTVSFRCTGLSGPVSVEIQIIVDRTASAVSYDVAQNIQSQISCILREHSCRFGLMLINNISVLVRDCFDQVRRYMLASSCEGRKRAGLLQNSRSVIRCPNR